MTMPYDPPDQAERQRALAVDQSFIVQAPAGSGKTTLLVERYLHLLASVQRPEEILAITFTRAAAMEMKQRVLKALADDNPTTRAIARQDQTNNWQLARNPHLLKIQTIDSFATELATQIPGAHSAEGMRIEDKPAPLYQQAARGVLNQLFGTDSAHLYISEFMATLDNNADNAERLLSIMLAKRDQWLDVARLISEFALTGAKQVEATLDHAVEGLRSQLLSTLEQKLSADDQAMIARVADATGHPPNISALLPLLLTQGGSIRKTVDRRQGEAFTNKELKTATVEWLQDLDARKLAGLLQACALLPESNNDASALIATSVTLTLAASELEQLLQQQRCLDFTGMLMRAMQGLRDEHGPTDLALYWDYRIKHLLVDEFQDTSRSQYQFFNLLTEGWSYDGGNTFFAVGDPMQSIYRFRDADVSIFSQCWQQGLPNVALEPLQLSANFRSDKTLVDWNNELFSTLFPRNSLPELGAIRFSPATAQRVPGQSEPNEPQALQLQEFADETLEAEAIARHLQALIQNRTADDEWSIGILCRARAHLPTLLNALKHAGIAFTSTDIDALAEEPIVRDLLSLHELLLRPTARLAWFSILRSPMVGLALGQLESFADATNLPTNVQQQASENPALARLIAAYDWAQQRLYEIPICEVIEGCWMRLGGVDAYPAASLAHAQRWFDLLESMGQDALEPTRVLAKTADLYAEDSSQSLVRVMTIHKSKGLEFTHVVLPNLGRRARPQETDLLMWRPTDGGLLVGIKNDSVHKWLAFEEKSRSENEIKRLLYVACTRAEQSLWLSSASCAKQPAGLSQYLPAFSRVEESPSGLSSDQTQSNEAVAQHAVALARQGELIHLPGSYQWQAQTGDENSTVAETSEAVDSNLVVPMDERSNRFNLSLGNLVHSALQHLGERQRLGRPFDENLLEQQLRQCLPSLDSEPDQWPQVMAEALRHIHTTRGSDIGRWLLDAHAYGRFEWPVTTVVHGAPRRLIMDRVFCQDEGWWIIDFKTSMPTSDGQLEEFISEEIQRYRGQLEQYKHALAQLLKEQQKQFQSPAAANLPIKTALFFTAMGHLEVYA